MVWYVDYFLVFKFYIFFFTSIKNQLKFKIFRNFSEYFACIILMLTWLPNSFVWNSFIVWHLFDVQATGILFLVFHKMFKHDYYDTFNCTTVTSSVSMKFIFPFWLQYHFLSHFLCGKRTVAYWDGMDRLYNIITRPRFLNTRLSFSNTQPSFWFSLNISKTQPSVWKTRQCVLTCIKSEAATRTILCKKVFLEISRNSRENTCARFSFLIKLHACNFIKKETLAQVLFGDFYEISKNTFFTEHLWTTASIKQPAYIWI